MSKRAIIWGANHFIDRIAIPSAAWIFWDKLFSEDVSFASGELAWTNCDGVVRKFTGSTQDPSRIHPTQKPVALYAWLLKNYAQPGQRILDTHLGSGSIAIACRNFGCALVATEIDADYFDAATQRISNAFAQGMLFSGNGKTEPQYEDAPLAL